MDQFIKNGLKFDSICINLFEYIKTDILWNNNG